VADARQERAERLVAQGDHSLGEIAQILGFASVSSFSTAFSRRAGCSPRAFARRKPGE
jgi:AraC-like DNA-binding protein